MDRGLVHDEISKSQALLGSLSARQRGLRERVAALRTRMVEGDTVAEAEIKAVFVEIDSLRFEADVLSKLNTMRGLFETIDEMLKSDWVLLAGQGMDLHNVRLGGQTLRKELLIAHQSWLQAVKESRDPSLHPRTEEAAAFIASRLEGAQARLHKLAGDANVRLYLQNAYEEIEDANTRAMLTQIAVNIGVALVASEVGGAVALATTGSKGVEGAALGARAVNALTQSVIVSGVNAAMSDQPGDSFGELLVSDVITNLAMFSNLAALEKGMEGSRFARILEGTEQVSATQRLVYRSLDLTLRTLTVGGTQAAGMQMDSVLRTGHSLSGEDMLANGEMGLAMMITHGVIDRLRARPLDQVNRLGPEAQKLLEWHADLEKRAANAEHPTQEQARKFLAEERAMYELEASELRRKVNEIGAGDTKLESQLASAEAHRGEAIARQGAEIIASAGLDPVVPGRSYSGSPAKIDQAAAHLRELGFKTRVEQEGGHRRIEATSPDGVGLIELVEHRSSAADTQAARVSPTPHASGAAVAPTGAHAADKGIPNIEHLDAGRFQPKHGATLNGTMEKQVLVERTTGTEYLFKPNADDAPIAMRAVERGVTPETIAQRAKASEVAAQHFGIDTPDVKLVEYAGRVGSLQEMRGGKHTHALGDLEHNDPDLYERVTASPEYARMRSDLDAFDYVLNNLDRNAGNLLVTVDESGRVTEITAIDHDLTFAGGDRFTDERGLWARELPEKYTPEMVERLRKIAADPEGFREALRPYLRGKEIDGAIERVNRVLVDVDAKIGSRGATGEHGALFDSSDTTVGAPSHVEAGGKVPPYHPRETLGHLDERYPGDVDPRTVLRNNEKNAKLAGKRHPKTGIVFDERGFPIFDDVAVFDTRIPAEAVSVHSRDVHMRAASKQLDDAIRNGQVSASQFSEKQLAAIRAHAPQIPGLTWHHHQELGRMQLVPEQIHKDTGHAGGFFSWY
jgi:hypothetical protein